MLEMATKLERPARRPRVAPPHVGEHIREDLLPDVGLTVPEAAKAIGVPRQALYSLCAGERALSPELAVKLAKLFGVEPRTLLGWQMANDIWLAEEKLGAELKAIKTRPRIDQ
jgi:addiction module HigA family antidote